MNSRLQRNLDRAVVAGLLAGIVAATDLAAADPVAAAAQATIRDWPQIGGPCGGFAVNDPSLRDDWTGAEGKVAWRAKLTAPPTPKGAAIAKGQVYVVDLDAEKKEAVLRVLGLDDGQERWNCHWPVEGQFKVQKASFQLHGSIPAVTDDFVYLISDVKTGDKPGPASASIRAIDLALHRQAWMLDPATRGCFVSQHASPIVVDDLLLFVAQKKGGAALVALDRRNGEARWVADAPGGGWMIHAPQSATIGGVRQIVMHHGKGATGFDLAGKPLWTWTDYQRWSLRSCPSVSPEGLIFVASGHEGSSAMFRVSRHGDDWTCTTIYADGLTGRGKGVKDKDTNPFWPTVPHLVDGNDYYSSGAWWDEALYANCTRGLHCTRADGTIAWHGKAQSGKAGCSVIAVNGRILTLEGVKGKGVCLAVYAADPKTRTQLATIPIHQRSHNVELAYAGGRVISVSPLDGEVVCVDLGAKRP